VWAVHCRYGWLITREIAERFHVSQSSVIRAIRRRRRAGSNDATQAQGHVAEDGPYRHDGDRGQFAEACGCRTCGRPLRHPFGERVHPAVIWPDGEIIGSQCLGCMHPPEESASELEQLLAS
jgi:hypothetical protein